MLTSFGAPARVWWANPQVTCCRYRVPVGAHPSLEAVIDVHAFSTEHAFVEVVVENCKVDVRAPAALAPVSYAAAVSINGAAIAAVDAALSPSATHQPFRAWYAAGWIGDDPGIEVTQDAAALQSHPLFFRLWKPAGERPDYSADAYVPWRTGRHPSSNLGGVGDSDQIGPLPLWETHYLQSGDANARRAVLASALSVLSFNLNHRDSVSGLVPDFDQLAGRNQQARESEPMQFWPHEDSEPTWEVAHHPAAGLMAFLCRPSPVFIEIAQKIAVWNGTWSSANGTFGHWYAVRGKAWCIRSLVHAIVLTPESDPWRDAGRAALFRNVELIKTFHESPRARLGFVWDFSPDNLRDIESEVVGFQGQLWQHQYLLCELHRAASARLLEPAQQAILDEVADWTATQPVRYVNESFAGEWRIHYYLPTIGRSATEIDSAPTWGEQFAWQYTDAPPPVMGPWMLGNTGATLFSSAREHIGPAGAYYESYFWAALVAAVERNVPGADRAWTTVTTAVTNLESWSLGFARDPRWGAYPRNR